MLNRAANSSIIKVASLVDNVDLNLFETYYLSASKTKHHHKCYFLLMTIIEIDNSVPG